MKRLIVAVIVIAVVNPAVASEVSPESRLIHLEDREDAAEFHLDELRTELDELRTELAVKFWREDLVVIMAITILFAGMMFALAQGPRKGK